MTFGGQTVGIQSVTGTGVYDELGNETVTTATVSVAGCRHRPLRVDETPEWLTNVGTQVWKTTLPPDPAAMDVTAAGLLVVDGAPFRVVAGAQVFTDMDGVPFKVTILSKIEEA